MNQYTVYLTENNITEEKVGLKYIPRFLNLYCFSIPSSILHRALKVIYFTKSGKIFILKDRFI